MQFIANLLHKVPGLSLRERFTFCMAPVHVQSELACRMLHEVGRLRRSVCATAGERLRRRRMEAVSAGRCGRPLPQFAAQYAVPGRKVRLRLLHDGLRTVTNLHDMADLEARNNATDVYLWLGMRLEGFVDLSAAEDYRDEVRCGCEWDAQVAGPCRCWPPGGSRRADTSPMGVGELAGPGCHWRAADSSSRA